MIWTVATTQRLDPPDNCSAAWNMREPVCRARETLPYSPNIAEPKARAAWTDATFAPVGEA